MKSLSGLVEYLKKGTAFDLKEEVSLIIHIESPIRVVLYSQLNENEQRYEYVQVCHEMPQFQFGLVQSLEEFIVGLQAKFVPTSDLEEVLKVVGNVRDEHVTTMNDDGVSQITHALQGAGAWLVRVSV